MSNFLPYPGYKKINLPWLAHIPAHWKIQRGKTIFHPIDVRSTTGEEELLTVSAKYGIIPRKNASVTMFKAESYVGYKLCWTNDLVINSLWAWATGLGISKHHGIVSSAYGVYRLKDSSESNPKFIDYFVRSIPFQWELQVRSKGVWTSRLQLTDESFLDAPFILPPLEEQNAIVRYLDHMNRLIKRNIRARQKQISLLEDTKWALTHKAISQGVSTNKCLINSDQDWLGAITVDANLRKLKYICQINPTTDVPKFADNIMVEFVPMEKVNEKAGIITEFEFRPFSESKTGFTSFKNHDLIFAKITPCMENGNCAIVSGLHHNIAYGSTEFIVFRANEKIIRVEFLHLLLRDKAFRIVCEANMKGSAGQKRVSPDFIGNIRVPVFSLEDQDSIIKFIYDIQNKVDRSINTLISEIKLLQEFLQVLIADTVTGKIDTRKLDTEEYVEEVKKFQDVQIADPVLSELEGEIE